MVNNTSNSPEPTNNVNATSTIFFCFWDKDQVTVLKLKWKGVENYGELVGSE